MGRAYPRGEMELRTPEDAPEACRACGDACRDDSHPPCCPCCITGWNIDIFSSASDSLMTSRLFLYSGKSEDHLLTIFVLWWEHFQDNQVIDHDAIFAGGDVGDPGGLVLAQPLVALPLRLACFLRHHRGGHQEVHWEADRCEWLWSLATEN